MLQSMGLQRVRHDQQLNNSNIWGAGHFIGYLLLFITTFWVQYQALHLTYEETEIQRSSMW